MSVSVNIDSRMPEFLVELGVALPAALEAIGAAAEAQAKRHISGEYDPSMKGECGRNLGSK